MRKIKKKRSRIYIITQEELKRKLKIKGEIRQINFYSGLSQADKESNKTKDIQEFEFKCEENIK